MKYLLKHGKASLHRYPVGQKILPKSHGFRDTSTFVLRFLRKIQKFKMDAIFWETIFGKLVSGVCLDTLWVENFDEIALFHTVKEIQAVLCFTRLENC